MKRVKPGRAPSAMNGCGALFASLFGIVWIVVALSFGAPLFFILFGVIFILLGIIQAVYHFFNAGSKRRFSVFDITEEREEPDPLDNFFQQEQPPRPVRPAASGTFCPYCGAPTKADFAFCRKCGKKLP